MDPLVPTEAMGLSLARSVAEHVVRALETPRQRNCEAFEDRRWRRSGIRIRVARLNSRADLVLPISPSIERRAAHKLTLYVMGFVHAFVHPKAAYPLGQLG